MKVFVKFKFAWRGDRRTSTQAIVVPSADQIAACSGVKLRLMWRTMVSVRYTGLANYQDQHAARYPVN